MKQLTSYNRVAGYLNKLFDLLNQRFFENELSRPTITIQSTPRAYGHFSMRDDTWVSVTGSSNEINIGAGTLARPIENICATLLHEMVHYYCHVNGIKDTSRGNTYHNKRFKEIAESHGLTVNHHEKYGWTITEPNDELLTFVLENDLSDILITRNEFYGVSVTGTGTHSNCLDHNIAPEARIFPITERAVQKRLQSVCSHLGYSEDISTHSFRKFYATEIYNDNGYNIVLVQQLLQHSSAAVTQRYIGIRQQELEKAIEGHLMLEV